MDITLNKLINGNAGWFLGAGGILLGAGIVAGGFLPLLFTKINGQVAAAIMMLGILSIAGGGGLCGHKIINLQQNDEERYHQLTVAAITPQYYDSLIQEKIASSHAQNGREYIDNNLL